MGIVKQLMMEREQYDWEETPVTFKCPECDKLSDGQAELPKIYDAPYEINADVEIPCIWCDEDFNATFKKGAAGCKIILDDHPNIKVDCEPIFYKSSFDDEWYDEPYFYDRPDRPFLLFEESYIELKSAIKKHAVADGKFSMNRMFFTQSFSMFEAYLCDAFLNLVFLNVENQNIFIRNYKDTEEMSLTIKELMQYRDETGSEIIKKKLTQVVKKNIFHNLEKVNALFKMYDIDLFPKSVDRALLFKSVEYRHHAVHRNGYDLEEKKLEVYTRDYVLEVSSSMMLLAKSLDKVISEIELKSLPF